MKSFIAAVVGLGVVIVSGVASGQDATKGAAPAELKDLKSRISYSLGLNIGRDIGAKFKGASIDADPEILARGFKDALTGSKTLLTDEQIQEVMQAFQKEMQTKQAEAIKSAAEKNKGAAEKNKKEGDAFLAANKAKPGVTTLPSGLQYKVVKDGPGKTPKATDTVSTHYRGTLLDGTEFDSSYKRGQPASFPVNGVIAGWTEALQKMKVGSKWQLFIPSELAYGGNPPPGSPIGPNSVLVFDIELLGVE